MGTIRESICKEQEHNQIIKCSVSLSGALSRRRDKIISLRSFHCVWHGVKGARRPVLSAHVQVVQFTTLERIQKGSRVCQTEVRSPGSPSASGCMGWAPGTVMLKRCSMAAFTMSVAPVQCCSAARASLSGKPMLTSEATSASSCTGVSSSTFSSVQEVRC